MPRKSDVGPQSSGYFMLPAGQDRSGQVRDIGIATITFKVARQDSAGLLIAEYLMRAKGGPARHVHVTQDEWFFVREGEFLFEIGEERHVLRPGDSAWGPRGVAHVWTYTSAGPGSIVFVLNPVAKMQLFFEAIAERKGPAPMDPEFWRRFEMELVGPPLSP